MLQQYSFPDVFCGQLQTQTYPNIKIAIIQVRAEVRVGKSNLQNEL
jgi:hypothetical protein